MFTAWKRRRRERQGHVRFASLEDPMEIIPVRADRTHLQARGEQVCLTVELPVRNAIERFTTRWFHMQRNAQVNLDATGAAFWELVDGRRNLRRIASELARRFKFEPEASRLATLQFTKRLLVRGFLVVKVAGKGEEPQVCRGTS